MKNCAIITTILCFGLLAASTLADKEKKKDRRGRRLSSRSRSSKSGSVFQTVTGNQLGFIGNDGLPTTVFPLAKCRGDCDDHLECAGDLICLERDRKYNADDEVPGCTGSTYDFVDICVDPDDLKSGVHYYIHNEDCLYDAYLPLEKCQGDCDVDADCDGAAKCYQRESANRRVPVPGCSGSRYSTIDYCYLPSDIPSGLAVFVGNNRRPRDLYPLSKCRGDCDKDSDCASGLFCYELDKKDVAIPVPGCGSSLPTDLVDYCVSPSDKSAAGLAECTGDCDYDGDCAGTADNICMERDRYLNSHGEVFGCTGMTDSRTDYCIKKSNIPANRLFYRANNRDRPHLFPLGKCEGDCDQDSDCAGALKCFQRSGSLSNVPGCNGPADPNVDYCY